MKRQMLSSDEVLLKNFIFDKIPFQYSMSSPNDER